MIYVGSYTLPTPSCQGAHGRGISIYDVKWSLQQVITTTNPSYLLIHNDTLYAVNELKNGTVTDFMSGKITSTGSNPCHLEWWDDRLVVCNYDGNINIGNYIIDATHPHFSLRYGPNIIITDLGKDTITEYNTALKVVNQIKLSTGSGPRHLSIYNNLAYVSNELSGSITVFSLTTWLSVQTIYGLPRPSHIQIYKGYLYIACRETNIIEVLRIQKDGKLISVQKIDCGGKNPRHFDIFQDELAVANQDSDNITLFDILDGRLKYKKNIQNDTPVFIKYTI